MNILYWKILCSGVKKKFQKILKSFLVFVVTCLIFVGCEPTNSSLNKNSIYFFKFPEEETVAFKNIYEYKEGIAGMLKLVDSTLIILNVQYGATNFLNNYSLNSGKLSKGYVTKGRGPNEAMGPRAIGVSRNSLWLLDVMLLKIFTINKRKVIYNEESVSFNEYKRENQYYMIDFKDSLHYFGIGDVSSEYKIQEVDLISGKVINEYGKIEERPGNMSLPLYKSVYQSFIFAKPTGDKLVLAYRFLDAIEIFNTETGSGVAILGPEEYSVEYVPVSNGMSRTDKTRFAFVNGTVTNEYIYLAYSGRTSKSSNSYDGNYIYVYDWNGKPIRKLILDRYIQGMAVSEDNKTLYSFDVNTGFIIEATIN